MMEKTLKMSLEMSMALNDLLVGLKPKGRVEIREHKHLFSAMRAGCCNERKGGEDQPPQHVYKVGGGDLKIERDGALEYLRDNLRKKVDEGVSGVLSIGYCDLDEAVEEAAKK